MMLNLEEKKPLCRGKHTKGWGWGILLLLMLISNNFLIIKKSLITGQGKTWYQIS